MRCTCRLPPCNRRAARGWAESSSRHANPSSKAIHAGLDICQVNSRVLHLLKMWQPEVRVIWTWFLSAKLNSWVSLGTSDRQGGERSDTAACIAICHAAPAVESVTGSAVTPELRRSSVSQASFPASPPFSANLALMVAPCANTMLKQRHHSVLSASLASLSTQSEYK